MLSLDDADPAGDLLLVLETVEDGRPTQASIRVSSKVLSLASPVFAAMLSPKFAEGQALLNATSQETPSISLPDDDSEAVIWLCKALHFKQDLTVKIDISVSLLKKLAILCDKYDLVGALNLWSHVWLQKRSGSAHHVAHHLALLWISYALGNEEYFWQISRSLMYLYTTEDLAAVQNGSLSGILPDKVLDSINNDREVALIELHKTFQDIMDTLVKHECVTAKRHNRETNYRACDHLTKIGYYVAQLNKYGPWLANHTFRTTSFTTILAGVLRLEGYNDEKVTPGSYSAYCDSPKIDIKQCYKQAAETAIADLKGLCLNCVKHGRYTRESPNCRSARRQTCKG